MFRPTVAAPALAAAGALVLALGGSAAAAPVDLGRHVAMCAQEHPGQREALPALMCTHDGMTMTFPTFGAMVQHMSEMHG